MKISKIVFATHNEGKIKEMKKILSGLKVKILSSDEAGVTEEIKEDKDTFVENAIKKAVQTAKKSGEWAVADDSGICIKFLNGAPGIKTARWAGKNATGQDLINKTLKELNGVAIKKRSAYFESAAAIASPDGKSWSFTGRVYGLVAEKPAGIMPPKLPYDVIFIPKGFNITFAQMGEKTKNSLSHRGLAFEKLKKFIKTYNLKNSL
jgi:XTP/dITP diphosphohydrolase